VIRTLLFTAMLLLPILAYGGNPSADLSVQVVPARSGALPGSILPSGNWINDLDEHFSGTSLNTSIWTALANNSIAAGGTSNCQQSGAYNVNNGLTIFPLPLNGTTPNGCVVQTRYVYSTPGYFEAYLQTDGGSGVWNGYFFEIGPNASCGGDFAQNGGEPDLVEAFPAGIAKQFVNYDGYGSCQSYSALGSSAGPDAYHVWGMNYGDNGKIVFYKDGVQQSQWAPADGVEPTSCSGLTNWCANGGWLGQLILFNLGYNTSPTNPTGLKVAWVRHYHH
jgi:hypothetical protein